MVGITVLVGILFVGFGLTGMAGDTSRLFTSYQQSSTRNTTSQYTTQYRWITIDNSYTDPRYKQLFTKLDSGNEDIKSADGFYVDYQNITTGDWQKFCQLTKESDEFNKYAGQLLYSQYVNETEPINLAEQNAFNTLMSKRSEYGLILKSLGLKEQDEFNFSHRTSGPQSIYAPTLWYKINMFIETTQFEERYKNLFYKDFLNSSIQQCNFSNNEISLENHVDFREVIKKTVNGSLYFWKYKQNKNFDVYKGKQPLKFSNGGERCWVQAGAQILISSTANNNLDELGNWGKFVRKLSDIQSSNRSRTIEFLDVLKSFCSSNEFDLEENTRAEVNSQLRLLEKGGTAKTAVDILLKIFPKLNEKKFITQRIIFEQPFDPILSGGLASDDKTYLPSDIAVRHLIPNMNNINDGIGKDPEGVTNIPNQYAEYRIKYSKNNKLMIYELRGMTLSERLASFKKISAEETFDKKERYTTEHSLHARAVIKLDNSPYWHYCDSNRRYFAGENIRNIFYNDKSVVDYLDIYKYNKPANHADLLMYELAD